MSSNTAENGIATNARAFGGLRSISEAMRGDRVALRERRRIAFRELFPIAAQAMA